MKGETEKEKTRLQYDVVKLKRMLSKDKSLKFLNKLYQISEKDVTILDVPAIRTII